MKVLAHTGRADRTAPLGRVGVVGVAAALGGLLWIVYGIFEFLPPWGVDAVYDDDRAYDVVVDRMLFTLYTAPGALALLLTSLCLLGTLRHLAPAWNGSARTAIVTGLLAVVAAVASLSGIILVFDPLATGMRIAGSLLLGVGTLAAASAVADSRRRYAVLLGLLGVVGLFLLPLWPLVYAVDILSAGAGTGVIASFGLGWVGLGVLLLRDRTHHGTSG